jgi:UDP-N-acetylmuramoyl-tripeptide--D-alanyl-D-alanine ligase
MAQARGAVALLVDHPVPVALPQVVVDDTRRALGASARGWRARFDLPVVTVTGSNGKTTVTQMIAAIFECAYGRVGAGARPAPPAWLATRGNLNNDVGVPLMVWRLRPEQRAAVFELGTNHPGEIAPLAAIAQPTVALVTNAQREHQEFFVSVAASAEENAAAIAALPAGGVAVFPADDACAPIWRRATGTRQVLDFALDGPAALRAQFDLTAGGSRLRATTPAGVLDTELRVAGVHHVRNALAATAAALAVGVPLAAIGAGLAAFRAVAGRGVRRTLPGGAQLIDDTYNANPDSMRAAVDVLAVEADARGGATLRVLVLGDMGEVGARGPEFHAEIGGFARERGIDRLLAFGPAMAAAVAVFNAGRHLDRAGRHFDRLESLAEALRATLAEAPAGAAVRILVKGSRAMRMERVIEAITGAATGTSSGAADRVGT